MCIYIYKYPAGQGSNLGLSLEKWYYALFCHFARAPVGESPRETVETEGMLDNFDVRRAGILLRTTAKIFDTVRVHPSEIAFPRISKLKVD